MGNVIGFGIGLLTGVIVGGVAAVLYAPTSGKATRRMLMKKTSEAVDAVKEKTSEAVDTVKEAASVANRKGHAAVYAIRN
ncbi:MAG: YtxH domain-containing protein [Dehalococcoidaceae bacterium]|nr:YtxH domain-containing protein [Dehalococcoidaceae bacterium]